MFATGAELHILIMNVEAFSTKKGMQFAEKFLSSHKVLMGIDESTTIKNPAAKRTKNIVSLRLLTKYRRILTGSPVVKITFRSIYTMLFLRSLFIRSIFLLCIETRYAVCRKINVSGSKLKLLLVIEFR